MEMSADTAGAVDAAPPTDVLAPTSADVTVEPAEVAAPEKSLDDELSAIFAKNNPPRENGKFAPKNPQEAPEPAAPDVPAMPASWAKASEETWKSLSPDARSIVLKREADSSKGVEQLKAQYEPLKGLDAALEPHKALLTQNGMTPAQGVQKLIGFHELMTRDRYSGIVEVARAYNVDLSRLFAPQGQRPGQIPVIDNLEKEVGALKAEREAEKLAREQQSQNEILKEIDAFRSKPEYEHFDKLAPLMAKLMIAEVATDVADAYTQAARLDPDVSAAVDAKAKSAADEKARVAAASRAGGINVKSTATSSVAPSKPLDDQLSAIWRRNHTG